PWVTKAPMAAGPRRDVGAAVIGGQVYVFGGANGLTSTGTLLEGYDPSTDSWTSLAAKPTAQLGGYGVIDDVLYVVGHVRDVEAYTAATNTWDNCGGLGCAVIPTPRNGAASAAVGHTIYVIGGFMSPNH